MLYTLATILHKQYESNRPGFRRFLAGCLVLAFGIICAWIFGLFWTQGAVILIEPNKLILLTESIMSFIIILFGLEILVRS